MTDAIGWLLGAFGYAGVAFLTFAETVFPPLPSEIVIPLAALHAQRSGMSLPGVIMAGTAGSMLGNFVWYALAWRFGMDRFRRLVDRHGRWLTMEWADIVRAEQYFLRHGAVFVFAGRMLPAIRTFVSVPAGLGRMALLPYLVFSTLGTMLWTGGLAAAGWMLGERYREIETVLGPLTMAIIAPFAIWYVWRLVRSFIR